MINKIQTLLLTHLDRSVTRTGHVGKLFSGSGYQMANLSLKLGKKYVDISIPKPWNLISEKNVNSSAQIDFWQSPDIHHDFAEKALESRLPFIILSSLQNFDAFFFKAWFNNVSVVPHLVFWISACELDAAGNSTFMDCVYLVVMETQWLIANR